MTNMEKLALLTLASRLEKLASLENAGFCFDTEEDKRIKEKITPYMSWFEMVADRIKDVVEVSDADRWTKQHKLEEIIRLNNY